MARVTRSQNRVDEIVDSLIGEILSGRLQPLAPLKEAALAARFSVSRNTIREAIRTLIARGLVSQHRHHSAAVGSLDQAAVTDLYRVRRVLELSALDQNPHGMPESFHQIGAAVDQLHHAIEAADRPAIIEADLAFHRAIVRLHRSHRLDRSFASCLNEVRLGLTFLEARDPILGRLLEEHRSIYTSLLQGERDRCRAILARHLDESERSVLAALAHP